MYLLKLMPQQTKPMGIVIGQSLLAPRLSSESPIELAFVLKNGQSLSARSFILYHVLNNAKQEIENMSERTEIVPWMIILVETVQQQPDNRIWKVLLDSGCMHLFLKRSILQKWATAN